MQNTYSIKPIAYIRNDFPDKFGIPRQSSLINTLKAEIVFEPEYRNPEAFRGLEDYSHIWLIWGFSENMKSNWTATVRPPRLGGNTRMGVFATRSPFRPNPLGLSSVRLESIELHSEHGPILHILGADLMNGTPIFDIKPYLPYADSHPEASEGFAGPLKNYSLRIECAPELLEHVPSDKQEALLAVLAQDPRPSYQNNPERIYGLRFAGMEIKFRVENDVLYVIHIKHL
ncbi:tRNA (N6-threonylcarbamoyladenosine(37)-N6)-methyltransferase TrmO [Frisingicoccus sp.]|uniref:tRNA (N6-threonylcarbamoyladenosine(37)-N6)-methyltransferase TrmO n=1 Tax=Frisingicoccus sp. TaxID=1918627 RepID=UPI003AB7972C